MKKTSSIRNIIFVDNEYYLLDLASKGSQQGELAYSFSQHQIGMNGDSWEDTNRRILASTKDTGFGLPLIDRSIFKPNTNPILLQVELNDDESMRIVDGYVVGKIPTF